MTACSQTMQGLAKAQAHMVCMQDEMHENQYARAVQHLSSSMRGLAIAKARML